MSIYVKSFKAAGMDETFEFLYTNVGNKSAINAICGKMAVVKHLLWKVQLSGYKIELKKPIVMRKRK